MNFSDVKSVTIPEGVVTEIKQGDTVLWKAQNGRLPTGYQEVEWIQSDGTAFINTGYIYRGANIEAVMEYEHLHGTTIPFFGYHYNFDETPVENNMYFVIRGKYSTDWYYNTLSATAHTSEEVVGKMTIKISGTALTITYGNNLTASADLGGSAVIFSATIPLHIFGTNNGTSHFNGGDGVKLYSFKTQDGYEFIPCYKINDNTIGVYRIKNGVADAFLSNASTSGSFTKGNNVT